MSVNDHDSAISVAVGESSKTPTRSHDQTSYPGLQESQELTEEEQAAHALENTQAAEQAETSIQVDNYSERGSDAGYESDSLVSASTSMGSSVRDFSFENGRRYHKFREGTYNFPNEESEQDREDMKHAMMVNLCQVLHFAPIGPNPQEILDMGTGTGIWAIDSELLTSS